MPPSLAAPRHRYALTLTIAAASAFFIAGCASTGAPPTAQTLDRYDELAAGTDGVRSFRAPDAPGWRLSAASPIEIRIADGATADKALAQEVRLDLERFLSTELQRAGPATAEAPRATVRAVVTQLAAARPAVNVLTTLLLLAPVSRGGLTVEIEAVDERTGRRIAALAYAGNAGIADIGKAYSSSADARMEAQRAAQRFATLWFGPLPPAAASTSRPALQPPPAEAVLLPG